MIKVNLYTREHKSLHMILGREYVTCMCVYLNFFVDLASGCKKKSLISSLGGETQSLQPNTWISLFMWQFFFFFLIFPTQKTYIFTFLLSSRVFIHPYELLAKVGQICLKQKQQLETGAEVDKVCDKAFCCFQ